MSKCKDTIELCSVSKSFQVDGEALWVFRELSLSVPQHEITVVLGKSGCGKTTLLRMIGRLDTDYSGEIHYPVNARTAFVFQEARLMPWLNVWDNITFGLKRREINPGQVEELLSLTGLGGFSRLYPRQLSGGMQQRVSLARALALKPQFLLMDEPFAALDYFTRSNMQEALLNIHRSTNCGVLFVTHSIDEAICLGDRIVIIDHQQVKKVYHLRERAGAEAPLSDSELKEDILQTINS